MSLLFVDEQTIAELNERFLGGTGPTDVLAFPMDDDVAARRPPARPGRTGPGRAGRAGDPPTLLGDVVVCPTVADRQAPEHGRDAPTTSSRCSSSTACCTCSTTTMPIREERR